MYMLTHMCSALSFFGLFLVAQDWFVVLHYYLDIILVRYLLGWGHGQ
jgi:hypothetical protein